MGDGCEGIKQLEEVQLGGGGGGQKQWCLEAVNRRASRGRGCRIKPVEEQI